MNRRLRFAALSLLLLAAGMAAASAQEAPNPTPEPKPEIPKAAPKAPLPPEPKDAGKKAIQSLLKEWFECEPRIPVKGKADSKVKAERARVGSDLEVEILKWPNCLRSVAWWRTRLEETQPSENKPSGIKAKEEFAYGEGDKRKTYVFAVSVPKSYRGNGTDVLPVIITIIDKDADPKKVLPATYGKLLDTHIIVASYEPSVPNAGIMLNAVYYAYLNYRCDRNRFVLDGIGKGARFVEDLGSAEYSALQWNGVVIRSPLAVQPLEGNFGLFPVAVLEPASPASPAATAAAEAHVKAGSPGVLLPANDPVKVQDFISSLLPRKAADQKGAFAASFRASGRMPKWGFWFLVNQAIDGENNQPIRVAIARDPSLNLVDIDATNLAEGTLLLNDEVLDLDQPVIVRVNGIVVAKEKVVRALKETFYWDGGLATRMVGPRDYFITAALPFVVPEGDARIPKADRDAAAAAQRKAEEDRQKQAETERLAAEAAMKAEEEAKNPKPAPAPGDVSPVPAGTGYFGTLEEAKAAARGRPILVVFRAARDDARQLTLDVALASEDVKKALAAVDFVTVPPAEAGDAGKGTRDLLAELSGAADTAAPFLALYGVKATLALAGLKEEEIQAAVLKLLAGLGSPAPTPAPAPVEKVPVAWGEDFDAARKGAAKAGTAIAVLFAGAADAKGWKELGDALANDGECTRSLSKIACVRLDTLGEKGAKNLELQKKLDPSRTPPVLCLVRIATDDKGAEIQTTLGLVDPANLLADEKTFLAKVRAQLALATAQPGAPAAGPAPAGDSKPTEPKPTEPKPTDPKPAEPKK